MDAVACWGSGWAQDTHPPPVKFTEVSAGGFDCGLEVGGVVTCWGFGKGAKKYQPPSGAMTAISVGYNSACAMRQGGRVICWGDDSTGETAGPAGRFTAVSVGNESACGLTTEGRAICWGAHYGTPPPATSSFRVSSEMETLVVASQIVQ